MIISSLFLMVTMIAFTIASPSIYFHAKFASFASWAAQNKKKFNTDQIQGLRFNIWLQTDNAIVQHNRKFETGSVTFKMGHSFVSDLTNEEKKHLLGFKEKPQLKSQRSRKATTEKTPAKKSTTKKTTTKKTTTKKTTTTTKSNPPSGEVDWRNTLGMIQPIRDQGKCGSCWAFASITALEAAVFKKTGKTTSLSEQQLVDCTYFYEDHDGCEGGWMGDAFTYLKEIGGSNKASSYPYESGNTQTWNECLDSTLGSSAVGFSPVTGYVTTPDGSEKWLQNAVATIGPVTIGFDVVSSFMSYSSGVYYDANCNSNNPNYMGGHAVVVVGYGTDSKAGNYWLIRNSWGTKWGEKGYFRMARNKKNLCGLATYAVYPTL